ncbi:MAG: GGDEF domain-containing protein [Spirochaetia bacterium]|jgi:diguanylate cyclase (GGDEF)-like protein
MEISDGKLKKQAKSQPTVRQRPTRNMRERVSFFSPRALFWTFTAGTTILAGLLGLAFSLLAFGGVRLTFFLGWLMVAVLTAAVASFLAAHILAQAWERQKSLEHFATVDELTGAPNRRVFASRLESEVDRCSRLASALCVVFIDIDFFKRINDDYGHQVGDGVLKEIYSRLEENLRLYDFIGRVGGDEFVMALPGTDAQTAYGVAERLRESVQGDLVKELPRVTVSLGVAELGEAMGADQLVRNADMALYRAKNNGRNRTEIYRPSQGAAHFPS